MKFRGVKSIASNAAYLASSHSLTGVIRGLYAIILARMLGPEIFGMYNYGLSWYLAFLPLTSLGLDAILAREAGRNHETGAKTMEYILALRTIIALSACLMCAGLAWFIESDEMVRYLLFIFSFALFGRALSYWAQSVFVAYEKSKYAFQQDVLFRLIELALGTTILIFSNWPAMITAFAIATVHALAWWIQGARGLALVRRHLYPVRPVWNFQAMKPLLRQSIPVGLSVLFFTWLQQGPLVLYRYFGGLEESLGCLALAMQALYLMSGLPSSLGRAALPILSRAVDREDGKDRVFIEAMLRIGMVVGALGGFAGTALGPSFVSVVFGSTYADTGELLGPVLWLMTPLIMAVALQQTFIAHARYLSTVVSAFSGAVAFTVTAPLLIATYDSLGAVMAAGFGMTVWAGSLLLILLRFNPVSIPLVLVRPGLATILATIVFYTTFCFSSWVALPLAIVTMAIGIHYLGVMTGSEKQLVRNLIVEKFSSHK